MEIESGLAFLSRIGSRFNISHLSEVLFPYPIKAPQIIEVSGEAGSGKTLLCIDILVSTLLPDQWLGINLNGLESAAIFIDCDLHFNIQQLKNLIQRRIEDKCSLYKNNLTKIDNQLDSDVKKFHGLSPKTLRKEIDLLTIKCLENFIYLQCSSSMQFAITLTTLDQIIKNSRKDISLVIVDSVSSFYWFDRLYKSENWQKAESYLSKIFQSFFNIIRKNNLFAICTRQSLFKKNYKTNLTSKRSQDQHDSKSMEYKYLGREWFNGLDWNIIMSKGSHVMIGLTCVKIYKNNIFLKQEYYSYENEKLMWIEGS